MLFNRSKDLDRVKALEIKLRRLENKLLQQNEQTLELKRRLIDAGRHLKRMQSHAVT